MFWPAFFWSREPKFASDLSFSQNRCYYAFCRYYQKWNHKNLQWRENTFERNVTGIGRLTILFYIKIWVLTIFLKNILFKNFSECISFTLDAWTSCNMVSFLGITCHWISDDWALHETLVDFVRLSGPHSGDNLCEAFERSCRELAIFTKVCLELGLEFVLY